MELLIIDLFFLPNHDICGFVRVTDSGCSMVALFSVPCACREGMAMVTNPRDIP